MRVILLILLLFLTTNCTKPKTVLICGDHACINNSEAEQYFEENLSIEVKIVNKNYKDDIDLVELNLQQNTKGDRKVNIFSKKNNNKKLKELSKNEKKKIKENIKSKKKDKKIGKKIEKRKESTKLKTKEQKKLKNEKFNANNGRKNVVDVCTILDKCSIDEISKYLIKNGKKKNFPDITIRE